MNTSSINHRPVTVVVTAATGLVGALLAITVNSAQAIPDPDPPVVVDRTVPANDRYVERACFIRPLTWNEALDGPLPRCYTYGP